MAGDGVITLSPSGPNSIRCYYSFNVTGSGRQARVDIIDVATHGGNFFKIVYLGAGAQTGSFNQTGLQPSTQYRFGLYDYYSQSDYTQLGSLQYATTEAESPPPPPTPSGTLSAEVVDPTTVSLNYSYSNGTDVSLFRDSTLVSTFGSGSGSGVYEDSGLAPDTEFTYTLRNGATIGSTLLATATVGTPVLPAEGTLSAQVIDSATIDLTYTFDDGTDVSLFRGTTRITTFGSGAGSGTYRNGSLTPDTSYTYYLRNGTATSSEQLATATGKTLKEAKKAIIAQGKILPLTSLVTIFDSTLTAQGILEDYEYLNWNFRYRDISDFKLIINRYKSNVEYLIKGNVLALYVAGYYRAGIIESIEIGLDDKGKISENYIITGRGLKGLLAERIALNGTATGTGYDSQSAVASTAMRHYVNVNCMDATDVDRNYPLLFLEDPDPVAGGSIKYDARFQYISEIMKEISLASGLGWDIVLDPTNKKMVFTIIEGLDRSWDNGVNSVVSFSPKFGNIKLITYLDSNIGSKNVAYVAGQGEANARDVDEVTYLAAGYTGMLRREVLIDARDLDATDKMLQRGNERLVEPGETKVFEMENLNAGPFSYGEDFYLGDIVTANYPNIIEADLRVIESRIEITPKDLIQNSLLFGKQFPDFFIINENKTRNTLPEIRR